MVLITMITGVTALIIAALVVSYRQETIIKLRPVVVLSHFYNNQLMYRAACSNDTVINLGTNHILKIDFIYGNHNGIKEMDNNQR